MMMTEKYKIMSEFAKDISSETPNIKTYLFVKENIHKYNLNIEITSKALKDKIIEINTHLKLHDKDANEEKSNFEIIYTTIIRLEEEIKNKEELQKIILCDVQNKIYPNLDDAFKTLLNISGYKHVKFDKKIDFDKLYKDQFN
jgi:preprotein translocase subunit SecB